MSESFITEWSHKPDWNISSIQVDPEAIEARPRRRGTSRPLPERYAFSVEKGSWSRAEPAIPVPKVPPEVLPAYQALCWTEAEAGVDYRPHLYDPERKMFLLVDSGSEVTAFPPEPGDSEVEGQCLKAVNGSKIKCYGKRVVKIKIARKEYRIEAFIADVECPVLGWDFIRKNKLEIIWNEFGDNIIVDKVAKVTQMLEFRSLPYRRSRGHKKLSLLSQSFKSSDDDFSVHFQVASMQALSEGQSKDTFEDTSTLPDSPYKEELLRHPELLKQNFHTDSTKANVVHRIKLKEGAKPFKSKVRKIIPGSPKGKLAFKAWKQLIDLGIEEKVNPSDPNLYTSPLHFTPKADGSLRPVGDYRLLNRLTELDGHPLPHLRDFVHDIAGCKVFSKVDLRKGFHQIVIDSRDRHLTCVTTPWGLFNFNRLSMGMSNSAQSFQRWVSSVVGDIPGTYAYLDDLLIFSEDHTSHMQIIKTLFKRLSDAGMTVAVDKCIFGVEELDYLGYKVNSSGLSPIQKKIEALNNFPKPS